MINLVQFEIQLRRGDTSTHQFQLNYVNESGVVTGPADLTGWNILAQARYSQQELLYNFPITITPLSGIIEFYVDEATSKQLLPTGASSVSANWEMQATVGQEVFTFSGGVFNVVNDLVDADYPTLRKGQVIGSSKQTIEPRAIKGRDASIDAVITEDTTIQIVYTDTNPEYDATTTKTGYLEGLSFTRSTDFDSLIDTLS